MARKGAKGGKGNCQVCNSKDRHTIELAMANGIGAHALARRFGIPFDSIKRHARLHLPAQVRAALAVAMAPSKIDLAALQESESQGLLASLVAQRARLQVTAGMAMDMQDLKTVVSCESAITGALALTAKVLGLIVQKHETRSTSILISADYLAMRAAIVAALRPFPTAARAVGEALAKLEVDAAKDIAERSAGKPVDGRRAPLVIEGEVVPDTDVAPAAPERTSEPRTSKRQHLAAR